MKSEIWQLLVVFGLYSENFKLILLIFVFSSGEKNLLITSKCRFRRRRSNLELHLTIKHCDKIFLKSICAHSMNDEDISVLIIKMQIMSGKRPVCLHHS